MCGIYNTKRGFALLELLIAIMIMGLIAAVAIPNFGRLQPRYERETFVARLNALVQLAWSNAVITNKLHKVSFDFGKKNIVLEIATGQKGAEGSSKFEPMAVTYSRTEIALPPALEIKQFFIEGFDEIKRFGGSNPTEKIWFFVVPEGLSQDVIINMLDKNDPIGTKARPVGLVLNPFSAQFKVHDAFQ